MPFSFQVVSQQDHRATTLGFGFVPLNPLTDELHHAIREVVHRTGNLD